jgi:nicotinamidase-related amidase
MSEAANLSDESETGCRVALLIVDMINGFNFTGGEALRRQAEAMAGNIAGLARQARARGVPVIYVNDNFGRWRSDFRGVVEHVRTCTPGAAVARELLPEPRDYFVLKPRHSGFLATSLEVLLEHLKARCLVLTGVAGDMCVLFTAMDAYMRHYELVAPRDCVASITAEGNARALALLRDALGADTSPSTALDLTGRLAERGSIEG